jgi:hypothetical protein
MMYYLQKIGPVFLTVISLIAIYLVINISPLTETSSKVQNESAIIDLSAEGIHTANLGKVQFNGNLAKVSFHLLNNTDNILTLTKISQSCACTAIPESVDVPAKSTVSVPFQIANHGRVSGKQRIRLEFKCESLNKVIPVDLQYESIIPVLCRLNTFYPIQQTEGVATVEIESTLDNELEKPAIDNSLFAIIDFQLVKKDGKPFRYHLKLKYPPLDPGCIELPLVFKVSGENIVVPLAFVTRELYQVSSDVSYGSDPSSLFTKATLLIKRWDGKPFCIKKVITKEPVVVSHDVAPKRKHQLIVIPEKGCDSRLIRFTLEIITDCEDLSKIETTCFVYKP